MTTMMTTNFYCPLAISDDLSEVLNRQVLEAAFSALDGRINTNF